MAEIGWNFVPQEPQVLRLNRNLGDALAVVAQKIWPHNTAKQAETEWGLDRSTGKNVVKGVAGGVVVTKAVRAQQEKHDNGWALWDALGELIIGESRASWMARTIAKEEARLARERQRYATELAALGQAAREMPALFGVGHNSRMGLDVPEDWAPGDADIRVGGQDGGSAGLNRPAPFQTTWGEP